MTVRISLLACGLVLAACNNAETPPPVSDGPRPEPIVVYASYDDASYLPGLFAGFTRETGIRVTVKHGDAGRMVDDVIAKRGSPPADLLLTPDVVGVWRAADEGALLPLASDHVTGTVPESFRDSDGYWTAISYQAAKIVFDADRVGAGDVSRFEDLADPDLKGRLCLSSASLAVNRAVIVRLIRASGARPAELVVRGWVANLALPPMDSEAGLVRAIAAGTCAVGIASADAIAESAGDDERIATVMPVPATLSVEAIGINRHAREPESARRLLEWMLSPEFQSQHSKGSGMQSVLAGSDEVTTGESAPDIAAIGAFDEDAVKLAERARYR